MVAAILIVIIASALGFEMLDAYTIRKVLPRIIIVAIAITLSWNLMEFLVTLSNDLGYGIRYLMYKPFENLNLTLQLGGGKDVAVTLLGGAAITALGVFGLLLFSLSAALSLFMAFVVMILRQILIIMLIIIAPIAIVCYILPNTQRVYTLWWNTFIRALLMFLIIEAIITAGRICCRRHSKCQPNQSTGCFRGLLWCLSYLFPNLEIWRHGYGRGWQFGQPGRPGQSGWFT